MRYPAPWDRTLRISTAALIVLIALWAAMPARRGPYVLLDTVSGRVVLTQDDPGSFVAAVRAGTGPRP